jgi:hypothetical protein
MLWLFGATKASLGPKSLGKGPKGGKTRRQVKKIGKEFPLDCSLCILTKIVVDFHPEPWENGVIAFKNGPKAHFWP